MRSESSSPSSSFVSAAVGNSHASLVGTPNLLEDAVIVVEDSHLGPSSSTTISDNNTGEINLLLDGTPAKNEHDLTTTTEADRADLSDKVDNLHINPVATAADPGHSGGSPSVPKDTTDIAKDGFVVALDSPWEPGQGLSSGETSNTGPSSSSSLDKGKQKQKAVQFQLPLEEQHSGSQSPPSSSSRSQPFIFQSLQHGDPGWDTSADRPPAKQPIRFKDAVGRIFVFPWEKAKTREGIEHLIRVAFAHVDVIGLHVNAGHYDLMVDFAPESAVLLPTPTPASSPGSGTGSSSTVPTDVSGAPPTPPAAPTPPSEPTAQSSSSQTPVATPVTLPQQTNNFPVVILPELWDDLIVPGASVTMTMWPIDSPQHFMPPPMPPGIGPQRGRGGRGGRARGRGRGGGRGMPAGPPPAHMHVPVVGPGPNGWFSPPRMISEERMKPPRGKTRIRRRGDSGL